MTTETIILLNHQHGDNWTAIGTAYAASIVGKSSDPAIQSLLVCFRHLPPVNPCASCAIVEGWLEDNKPDILNYLEKINATWPFVVGFEKVLATMARMESKLNGPP